jgi:hypothetical protein
MIDLTLGGNSGSFASTLLLLSPSARATRECWTLLSKCMLPVLLILLCSHLRVECCLLHCILRSWLLLLGVLRRGLLVWPLSWLFLSPTLLFVLHSLPLLRLQRMWHG